MEEITPRPGLSMEAVEAVGLVWEWEGYAKVRTEEQEAMVGWMPYVSQICQSPGFMPRRKRLIAEDTARRRAAFFQNGCPCLPEEKEIPPYVTSGWARRMLRLIRWFCSENCPADHADGYIQEFLTVSPAVWRVFFAGWGRVGEEWRRRVIVRAEGWRVCALLAADADRLCLLL
jgi:hypothetical protein